MNATIHIPDDHTQLGMVGRDQRNLKMIRESLGVSVTARSGVIHLSGAEPELSIARRALEQAAHHARSGHALSRDQFLAIISEESTRAKSNGSRRSVDLRVYSAGQRISARTPAQQHYLSAVMGNDLTFGIGPAGTGKTYLAVACAVHALREGQVNRVILCRPAVEAGEKLGFLPGDLEAKVNPYLRPLLDALHDMMEYRDIRRFVDSDVIEIVPLAFMRGRTLNGAFIILDEAQNTTIAQMQMFLTRLGHGSKMVVTGDTTQIDLPDPRQSGLIDAARRLRRVRGVGFAALDRRDVVRHPLVQRIIESYDESTNGPDHGVSQKPWPDPAARTQDRPEVSDRDREPSEGDLG